MESTISKKLCYFCLYAVGIAFLASSFVTMDFSDIKMNNTAISFMNNKKKVIVRNELGEFTFDNNLPTRGKYEYVGQEIIDSRTLSIMVLQANDKETLKNVKEKYQITNFQSAIWRVDGLALFIFLTTVIFIITFTLKIITPLIF